MSPIYNTTEEDNISFYCSMLTDSKGERSYIYILNMYDKYKDDNMNSNENYIRIPLHLCMISKVNDSDAFRMLLNETYLIMTSEFSLNYKKVELLNYLMFISSIIIPPRHSLLTLNLNYMTVDFYFHSKQELPTTVTDTSINILFSVLDVSKIIKLWICVLQERQIIIYGNKPFLLHAIIDAITKLIFPFKYPYSIISCLPVSHLDLLEMPSIYIMGVLSSCISIQQLQQKLPETCIVDLETGHISVKKVKRLPREDEILLRKQIQFVKNPELFEKAELFKSEKNIINNDDIINMNLSFSSNIQRIFFQLFKQTFKTYKEYIKVGVNKLDEKRYLKGMDPEKGEFWEKILNSAIVDLFISDNEDNSNRSNFDEICKIGMKKATQVKDMKSAIKIEMTCPKVNRSKIIKELKDIGITDNISELEQILNEYHEECMKSIHGNSKNINEDNNSGDEFDNQLKKDNHNYQLVFHEEENVHISSQIKDTTNIDMEYAPLINSFKDSNFINTIPNQQENNNDIFYFYNKSKGFLTFIKKCESLLSKTKYNLKDIFFEKSFLHELYEQSLTFLDTLSLSSNSNIIEEKETEYDENPIISNFIHFPLASNTQSTGRKLSTIRMRKSFVTISPIKHSTSLFSSPLHSLTTFPSLTFKNTFNNKMQKILFYSFYLEELYFNEKYSSIDKQHLIDHIINMYHKSIVFNIIDFPYGRYVYLLSKLSTDKLNSLNNDKNNMIPQQLKKLFSEVLENSFAKIRANLSLKTHFQKERESLSPGKKKHSHAKSNTPNLIFEGGYNKLVDFARASEQLKQDYKKGVHSLKKNLSKQDLFDTHSSSGFHYNGRSNPLDLDKFMNSPRATTSEFSFLSSSSKELKPIQSNVYRFGIATDFTSPIVLNQHKLKYQTANPLMLIIEIGNSITTLMNTLKENKISLYRVCELVDYKVTLENLRKLIDKLQFMNLTKFTKTREKYCFWLNAFNFLLIYSIIYSGFQPRTFEQWDNVLLNGKYDIGRYKYSLYEILVCFLKCYNFHESEIVLDLFLQKFLIKENNVLINFCIYFPIKANCFELKVYKEEIFEEQTYQTVQMFFKNNLKYDDELEEMEISRYLERVFPMILDEDYKIFKIYIDKTVYDILDKKQFQSWRLKEINWDVIDYTESYI